MKTTKWIRKGLIGLSLCVGLYSYSGVHANRLEGNQTVDSHLTGFQKMEKDIVNILAKTNQLKRIRIAKLR